MNTRPQLCLGHVMHRRLRPAVNAFVYPVFYVQLPVRDLAAADCGIFSVDQRNLLSFRSQDHGPRDGSPLLPWIENLLASTACRPMARSCCRPSPRARLCLQPGQLLVLPRPQRRADRHPGRGEQHLRRQLQLPAAPQGRALRDGEEMTADKLFHVSPSTKSKAATASASTQRKVQLARIDYDDAEGELLLTSISGKPRDWSAAAALAPSAHAFPHPGRHRPHPLAGAETVAQGRALPWRPSGNPTPTGIDKMNNTLIRAAAKAWLATPARSSNCSKNCRAACSKSVCPTAPAPLFGDGEAGVTLLHARRGVFGQILRAATSAWPKPTSTASGIRPT
jgi:hypothetical protein